ncbi:MAG: hypothetical protein B6D41_11870 [Chloroflexi bacterium UTCFX4]|nr:MAG: hypothetical protein B6D41_11870 [Chloroflexi bacterium UTCFX4]
MIADVHAVTLLSCSFHSIEAQKMLATLTPTERVNPNTATDARTIEFITPNALRCHCQEYRTNHFCLHLVFYAAAKIRAFQERNAAPTHADFDGCEHRNLQGDNYALHCLDCGAVLETF